MTLIQEAEDAAAFFCISEDGEVGGFIEVSLRNFVDGCLGGPVGYIEGLYLLPEFRNQGHGRVIVERASDWFRERGCREMATDAELHNTPAHDFFMRIGFAETFRIVEFRRSLARESPKSGEDAPEDWL